MNARLLAFVAGTAVVLGVVLWISSSGDSGDGGDGGDSGTGGQPPAKSYLEEYREHGGPPPDRTWTARDYAAADKVLRKMMEAGRGLPKYQHATTGALFARMTSSDNLAALSDDSQPLMNRLGEAVEMQGAANRTLKLYIGAVAQGYSDEGVEVMAHQAAMWSRMLPLTDQFMATLSPSDPKYQVRMEGFAKMRRGVGLFIDGALITMTESRLYGGPALARFARHLKTSLPILVTVLPEERRPLVRKRLTELAAAVGDSQLEAAILELAGVL
jgi:hypothetical protein